MIQILNQLRGCESLAVRREWANKLSIPIYSPWADPSYNIYLVKIVNAINLGLNWGITVNLNAKLGVTK